MTTINNDNITVLTPEEKPPTGVNEPEKPLDSHFQQKDLGPVRSLPLLSPACMLSDVFLSILRTASMNLCNVYYYGDVYASKTFKYIMYEAKLLYIFQQLDAYLLQNVLDPSKEDECIVDKYYFDECLNKNTIVNKYNLKTFTTSPTIDEFLKYDIVEYNMWYDNKVVFREVDIMSQNYTNLPQFDSAISIFEMEKGSWDTTYLRLKKEPLEMYKLKMMYQQHYSLHKNLNFIRETIGRIIEQKNYCNDLFKKRSYNYFRYDSESKVSEEKQREEFVKNNPCGLKFEELNVDDICVGQWVDTNRKKNMMRRLGRIKACFIGYGSDYATAPPCDEIYVSRASTAEEFNYELRCLVCYCIFNNSVNTIAMLNPRLAQSKIDKYLNIITSSVSIKYDLIMSPLIQLYQHNSKQNNYRYDGSRILEVHTDDFFAILKGTTLAKTKIKIAEDAYIHLLDYRSMPVKVEEAMNQNDSYLRALKLYFQDSSFTLRSLSVLGLVAKTTSNTITVPRKYVVIRKYIKELARQISINSDYIVQKAFGNYCNLQSCTNIDEIRMKMLHTVPLHCILSGNLNVNPNVKDLDNKWIPNSFMWDDSYIIRPDEDITGYNNNFDVSIANRLDWYRLRSYIDIEQWDFGDFTSYLTRDKLKSNTQIVITKEMDYRVIRNTMIRYTAVQDKSFYVMEPYSDGVRVRNINLDRAISTTFEVSFPNYNFVYMCEIPTMMIFSISEFVSSSFIKVHPPNLELSLKWLNLNWKHDGYNTSQNSEDSYLNIL